MSVKSIEKIDNEINPTYFSFFNYKLYDSPLFIQEEKLNNIENNNQSTEESYSNNDNDMNINSLNIEDKFIPLNLLDISPKKDENLLKGEIIEGLDDFSSKDIKPELHKFILPKSLFNSSKSRKNNDRNITSNVPKKNIINIRNNINNINNNTKLTNNIININISEGDSFVKHLNLLSQPFVPKNKIFSFIPMINSALKNDKNKKRNEKKKNKNNFVKREGDWTCFMCKNLNFAFRKICNKCKLPKEESEKKFFDVGKELMKLADLSISNRSKI